MSRSVRKEPISGYAGAKSEKWSKTHWHQKMRAIIRLRLHDFDPDTVWLPLDREAIDVWCMAKDGKIRFDPLEQPWRLRK